MLNIQKDTFGDKAETPTGLLLIYLLLYLVGGFVVILLLSPFLLSSLYGISITQLSALIENPEKYSNGKEALLFYQAFSSFILFVLTPALFMQFSMKNPLKSLFKLPSDAGKIFILILVILFCFIISNSVVIEWNQGMKLPEFLSGFESWAQDKELKLKNITEFLTTFDNIPQFLVGLVIIALIPGIGEELLFRGVIQNLFGRAFNNPHLAIWSSAIIFGAFHMQFYGVIPRTLLGALFGYLYYWSGNLSFAMFGHFVNNAFTLLLIYLSTHNLIDFDPTDAEVSPPIYVVLIFFVAGGVLLYLFKNLFSERNV